MNRTNRKRFTAGRRLATAAFAATAALLLVAPVAAQEASLRIDSADTSGYPVVDLTVTVRGGAGAELGPDAFTVAEGDGEAVAAAAEPLGAESLSVILVLDTSGSMQGEPLAAAKDAAEAFIASLPTGVEVAVLGFGTEPTLHAGFGDDATRAIASLEASGETALYDALATATASFPEGTSRAWVVLLSDGGDTASATSLDGAIQTMNGSGVGFYAVQLQSPEADFAALDGLAAATEGTVVEAGDAAALAGIFAAIATDLVNQYRITYTSGAYGATDITVAADAAGVGAVAAGTRRLPAPPPPVAIPAATTPPPEPAVTATTVAPAPSPQPAPQVRLTEPGLLAGPEALAAGGALVFLSLLGILLLAQGTREKVATTARRLRRRREADERTGLLGGLTDRATLLADKALERNERAKGLNTRLEQAGVRLRPGEFVLVAAAVAVGMLAVGSLLRNPILGLALAASTFAMARGWLTFRAARRRAAFAEQLGDTLQLLAGSIRAGYGLLQAIEAAASEALPPTSEEFSRLLVEIQLGRDLTEALGALADRSGSDDFRWVVEAIEIHRQVGGDLSEILDIVSTTIRDRTRIRRRIKALSAEGKLSAIILVALPICMGIGISFTNPSYMAELTGSIAGRVMVGGGLGLMLMGTLWMRKIVQPRF